MPKYRYHVVPFVGKMKAGEDVEKVSDQLAEIINHYASHGWEFHSLDNVDIKVQPGCLAGFLGHGPAYVTFNQIILRQEVVAVS